MSDFSVIETRADALVRGGFREWLNQLVFAGWHIEWREAKTFLDSNFVIKGPEHEINRLKALINKRYED